MGRKKKVGIDGAIYPAKNPGWVVQAIGLALVGGPRGQARSGRGPNF